MTSTATRRIDVWLWYARFFKTRTAATRACEKRRVRLNSVPIRKPSHAVRVGDVLTLPFRGEVRVVRVVSLGQRRGPVAEAHALFIDAFVDADEAAPAEAPIA